MANTLYTNKAELQKNYFLGEKYNKMLKDVIQYKNIKYLMKLKCKKMQYDKLSILYYICMK